MGGLLAPRLRLALYHLLRSPRVSSSSWGRGPRPRAKEEERPVCLATLAVSNRPGLSSEHLSRV